MKYTYVTYPYSIGDNYTVSNEGTNPSTIITKLIHLAGRLCEHYASDIVDDATSFREAVENHKPYDRYLFFRECGVTTTDTEHLYVIEGTVYLQVWHLTYNPETEYQMLTRVYVRKEVSLID